MPKLNKNDRIGNYRVVTEINSGSYGSVYTAKHIFFDDKPVVAIKVLHASLVSQDEKDNFIQEARILNKLQHPHILPILDAGIHEDSLYFIVEFARGGTLKDRLQRYVLQPLTIEEAIKILSQVGQALQYAHQQNITHRDLKPANILFNANNEALLADFGIAATLESGKTNNIGFGGTIAYMAPEQFEGIVSIKSDQYALGCIAYELFTGRHPFTIPNPTLEAMWYQHAKVDTIPPRHFSPSLPIFIEQAILKAMAKQRENRYANISNFIEALQPTPQHWIQEGNNLQALGLYKEALVAFEQGLLLNPQFALIYVNKGNVLYQLKRYEEALEDYNQALRLEPDSSEASNGLEKILSIRRKDKAGQPIPQTAQIIYLSPADFYEDVRKRLEQTPSRHIILVIPQQTQLRSLVGWRLLWSRARELNKEIFIISADRQIRSVVKAAGFRVADSLTSMLSPSKSREEDRSGRMNTGNKPTPHLRGTTNRGAANQKMATPGTRGSQSPLTPSPSMPPIQPMRDFPSISDLPTIDHEPETNKPRDNEPPFPQQR